MSAPAPESYDTMVITSVADTSNSAPFGPISTPTLKRKTKPPPLNLTINKRPCHAPSTQPLEGKRNPPSLDLTINKRPRSTLHYPDSPTLHPTVPRHSRFSFSPTEIMSFRTVEAPVVEYPGILSPSSFNSPDFTSPDFTSPCTSTPSLDSPDLDRPLFFRMRTSFTYSQLETLEETYKSYPQISRLDAAEIARRFGIPVDGVTTWFSNRRAKQRKDKQRVKSKSMFNKPEPNVAYLG